MNSSYIEIQCHIYKTHYIFNDYLNIISKAYYDISDLVKIDCIILMKSEQVTFILIT